jgi:hypothetical protein
MRGSQDAVILVIGLVACQRFINFASNFIPPEKRRNQLDLLSIQLTDVANNNIIMPSS